MGALRRRLSGLVNMLADTLGSPVVNKDRARRALRLHGDAGTCLFASVDQPGLKLEAKKVPVEVLVDGSGGTPFGKLVSARRALLSWPCEL